MNALDLSLLPPPTIVEQPSFAAIMAELKADLIEREPSLAPAVALPSELTVKLLEVFAYRITVERARSNHRARALMLAYATGADLDQLAANLGVRRQLGEDDARLRSRAALAPEGWSTAGPAGAYVFHALSADVTVADVAVDSPTPGQVRVTVLSSVGDGAPTAPLLAKVLAALNADEVRPLTDQVLVQAAVVVAYQVTAALTVLRGPDPAVVLVDAWARATAYIVERRRLGRDVTRAGLLTALFAPGVQNVTLTLPAADVAVGPRQAAWTDPAAMTLTVGGVDD